MITEKNYQLLGFYSNNYFSECCFEKINPPNIDSLEVGDKILLKSGVISTIRRIDGLKEHKTLNLFPLNNNIKLEYYKEEVLAKVPRNQHYVNASDRHTPKVLRIECKNLEAAETIQDILFESGFGENFYIGDV